MINLYFKMYHAVYNIIGVQFEIIEVQKESF